MSADLVNTALTVASLVNVKGMFPCKFELDTVSQIWYCVCVLLAQIMHSTERLLRSGTLNERYVEVFAMHDMQRLLEVFDDGTQEIIPTVYGN